MTFVSLFAGIGGIDLGLERAGHACVGQVEIDPYARRVLAKHWPDTPRHDDISTFRGDEFGTFDMLTAGYPCQGFSVAGKRAGEADERFLWPEVHRIIRNVRPVYVLLENVTGHLALGFGRVLGDLAESGYDAEWDCIPAAAVGAPHLRDRVFIVARPQHGRDVANTRSGRRQSDELRARWNEPWQCRTNVADAEGEPGDGSSHHAFRRPGPIPEPGNGRSATRPERAWRLSEPPIRRGADGVSARLDRLRTLGNAVVPQVAEWIGRRLPA